MTAELLDVRKLLAFTGARLGAIPTKVTVLGAADGERLVLRAEIKGCPIVVKVVSDGSAAKVARTLVALEGSQSQRTTLVTPRLLFVAADRGVVAMTALDGVPFPRFTEEPALCSAMCRAGIAAAELHRTRLPGLALAEVAPAEQVRDLIRPAPSVVAEAVPRWAPVIERAMAALLQPSVTEAKVAPVPIHRDLHLRQLVRLPSGVGLVDWDLLALGDPAFDVAFMLTYLETHLGELAAPASQAFLAGYRAAGGPADDRSLARYRCFNLLRRACRRFRLRDRGWEQEMVRMLSLLERSLDSDVAA